MSLFQNSVLNKYLNGLNETVINNSWKRFTSYFHNSDIQKNIRNSKEEEYGGDFLTELFVNVLGYTKNPNPNFNLKAEQKNFTDSKKADGAFIIDEQVVGVIELKGTDTTDLSKVESQAFGYKNHQPEAVYVVTSNFEKLRFYIDNAVDFEEFNLFQLNEDRFKILWLCLAKENIYKGIPKKIKDESLDEEELITKKLYKDYSTFKHEVFTNIVKLNPQYDKLLLFKKTQKLLDRFLFIFFAEDRLLLPPNSIREIIKQWRELTEQYDEYKPLYERFKKYFNYMNTGFKGRKYQIFAYNGGLFKSDDILDNLKIVDETLYKHSLKLSHYDFESEVSVNILGHIFEHSLNEIEEISTQLEGKEIDKSRTKRKKDGVYYTPKYITKYIVDNTVGKLCDDKKVELGILEEEYEKERKGRRRTTLINLINKLEQYRKWLLEITICDPACGSGAFLIQALDFLIGEHNYVDELHSKLLGNSIVYPNVTKSILENNLYGVDINEEAVEIAKLSLWLRTAQKGRKLTTLSNNIKCGNSLIDDKEIDGEKAFNWKLEYGEIFNNGGFDVVIGNPPYVRQELISKYSEYYKNRYKSYSGKADLYTYFIERGIEINKSDGILSYISSGKYFEANYGKPLVEYLTKNIQIISIINFRDLNVFEGITSYPLIQIFKKSQKSNYDFKYIDLSTIQIDQIQDFVNTDKFENINIIDFVNNGYQFIDNKVGRLIKKLNKDSTSLRNLNLSPLVGIKTGYNEGFITEIIEDEIVKPYIFGKNIKRYNSAQSESNIIFPYIWDTQYKLIGFEQLKSCKTQLLKYEKQLSNRAIIKDGIVKETKSWYEYQQINKTLFFDKEYIVYPNVSLGNNFTLSKGNVIDMTGFIIPTNNKGLLAILNSKMVKYLLDIWAISRRGGYLEYKVQYLNKIPIKHFNKINTPIIENLVSKMLNLVGKQQLLKESLIDRLIDNFPSVSITNKIKHYFEYDFSEIINELKKQKITFKLGEQDEWSSYFKEKKEKISQLQAEIINTDRQIDKMVYDLYELTERERQIIEGID